MLVASSTMPEGKHVLTRKSWYQASDSWLALGPIVPSNLLVEYARKFFKLPTARKTTKELHWLVHVHISFMAAGSGPCPEVSDKHFPIF